MGHGELDFFRTRMKLPKPILGKLGNQTYLNNWPQNWTIHVFFLKPVGTRNGSNLKALFRTSDQRPEISTNRDNVHSMTIPMLKWNQDWWSDSRMHKGCSNHLSINMRFWLSLSYVFPFAKHQCEFEGARTVETKTLRQMDVYGIHCQMRR